MKKKHRLGEPWENCVKKIIADSDEVLETLRVLDNLLGESIKVRPSLRLLRKRLNEIRGAADTIHARLCREPAEKILGGISLTEEEYFIMRAKGIHFGTAKELGLSSVDDYEIFLCFCYRDGGRSCYINPGLKPDDSDGTTIRIGRFGKAPEELNVKHLRQEQQEFFRKYLPNTLKRFQRD